jgi:hypothetical protein
MEPLLAPSLVTSVRYDKEKEMFVDTVTREIKKNRVTTTVVVEYVDTDQKFFVTNDGTAVVSFDTHDSWNMHIKLEQAELLVKWAKNLVKAFDEWED